jgi:hypothetical protein
LHPKISGNGWKSPLCGFHDRETPAADLLFSKRLSVVEDPGCKGTQNRSGHEDREADRKRRSKKCGGMIKVHFHCAYPLSRFKHKSRSIVFRVEL